MGAGIFLAAAAVAANKRKQRMAAARSRKRKSEEARKSNSSEGYYGSDSRYSFEKPYIDSVMREIMYYDGMGLEEFALKLDFYCREMKAKKGEKYAKEAEKCMSLIEECNAKRKKMQEELVEMGVTLGGMKYFSFDYCDFTYVTTDGTRVSGLQKYKDKSSMVVFHAADTFNGLKLTDEMLTDPNNTYYRDRYEDLAQKYEPIEGERAALIEEIERKEKRLKYTFFNKEEKEADITKLKEKLAEIDRKLAELEQAKMECETFEKLTPQQKKKISEYLGLVDSMIKTASMISKYGREYEKVSIVHDYEYEKETIEEGLSEMIEKEGMSEEDIDELFKKLDLIAIRRNRGEYDFSYVQYGGKKDWKLSDYKRIKGVMEGFIRYVYEEDDKFVERNLEDTVIE